MQYWYSYDIGIGTDICSIGIGLYIVVWLQYKLEDFNCGYGANFLRQAVLNVDAVS